MESVEFLQGLPGWVNLLIAAGLVLAGVVITLVFRGPKRAPVRAAEESLPGVDREVQKTIARLESDNAALSHLFQLIPGFTKKMNSRIERREIPMEAMRVLEQLFAPSQILVFLLEERVGRLSLVKQMGLPPDFSASFQVGFGEGRIGWVAQHNVPMDVDDFIREKRLTGANLDMPGHFQFKAELCAPMSHEDKVRGVISVGGITRHYKHEKGILSLVADLASIALYNHDLFARTQEMANCDGLTKLYNKRFFMEKLSNVLVDAGRGHHPFSVFLFDLDNFKHYNDTQGHQAGDEVLKVTGELLRDSLRPDDIAARFGGEEFIVLLAHAPAEGAMQAAERIRTRVAEHAFANRESQPLKIVSLSGGVATYPDDGLTSSDLIASADAALYRAKREGRNRVFASKPKYFSDEADDATYKAQTG
jgi:diguanylate cyclase (GGDEF)-like protein